MNRTLAVALCLLAVALAVYGWSNTYVSVSTDAPHAYRPYILKACLFLGLSQTILAVIAVKTRGWLRHIAVGAILFNCFPLFNNFIHASFVLF